MIKIPKNDFKKVFQKEIKAIPATQIKRINNKNYSKHIVTDSLSIKSRDQYFSMASISTYPIINGVKQGEPNCDKVGIIRFENATFIGLADGCGWGEKPAAASKIAVVFSFEQLLTNIPQMTNLREVATLFVEIAENAQRVICNSNGGTGQTTLLIALSLSLINDQLVTLVLSIGDCQLTHYSTKENKIKKIIGKGHNSIEETQDCIACLGGNDLGNEILKGSELSLIECEEGDLIIAMSDGMYDNFNPMIIKEKKTGEELLNEIIVERMKKSANLNEFVEELCNFVVSITQIVREFHQDNPKKRRPDGLPGKLDHSTILVHSINAQNLDIGLVDKYTPELFKTLKSQETRKPLSHSISFDEQNHFSPEPVLVRNNSKISIHPLRLNTFSPPRNGTSEPYAACVTPRIYRDL